MNYEFKEYYAWLQPKCGFNLPCVCIKNTEHSDFAAEELKHGLLWQNSETKFDNNGFVIDYIYDEFISPQAYELFGSISGVNIVASGSAGFLYGTYAFLSDLSLGINPSTLNTKSIPRVLRRAVNHWDNMSGSIERGYSGKSFFFRDGRFQYDYAVIRDYARLLASIGINELCINNVNVDSASVKLITKELLPQVALLAEIFRPFEIKLLLSVDFEAPSKLGGLETADPLDDDVIKWWREAVDVVYSYVPDLAGFVVKADSEFRGGPAAIGRTQADGANMMASVLQKFNAVVYWRCFVYNCKQDWRDKKTDRPKAAYDNFAPLDGTYQKNVILQIKNGPVDFQVREPASPLFGAMKHTSQAIEFQITQEYTGQQIDLFALAVTWEEFFNMPIDKNRNVSDLVGREVVAVTGVSNIGSDNNWTGHLLAQANLYAFGLQAWNPNLSAEDIISKWVYLTFGDNPKLQPLIKMMLDSRDVYEKYTSPLGLGWMVNVSNHYGPSPDGYEFMMWGTYHRADFQEIGVDRTVSGTGYTSQYDPWLCDIYSNLESCPEELLLFFHRLSYNYVLKNGKTLLQHIYDTHFEGVEDVEEFIRIWSNLENSLPSCAYNSVLERLNKQLTNAVEWRDVINTYFYRKTGVADNKGRLIYS